MKTAVGTDMGCRYGKDLLETRRMKREVVGTYEATLETRIDALNTSEVKDIYVEIVSETDKAERITDALTACSACKGDPEQATIPDGVCPMARFIVGKHFG